MKLKEMIDGVLSMKTPVAAFIAAVFMMTGVRAAGDEPPASAAQDAGKTGSLIVNGVTIGDLETDCSNRTGCAQWHYVALEKKVYFDSEGAAYIVYGHAGSGVEVDCGDAALIVLDSVVERRNPRAIAPGFQEIQYDYWNRQLDVGELQPSPADGFGIGFAACWNGRYAGGNLVSNRNDEVSYLIRIPAVEGRHASIGIAHGPENDPDDAGVTTSFWEYLPERTLDGINDAGVCISVGAVVVGGTNHVRTTGTNPGKPRLEVSQLPRYVLDNADSPSHAVELLKGRDLHAVGTNEFHWLIASGKEAYLVECVDNRLVAIKAKDREAAIGIECYDEVTNGLAEVSSRLDMLRHLADIRELGQVVHTCAYNLENNSLAVMVNGNSEPYYIDFESGYGEVVKPVAVAGEVPYESVAAAIEALSEDQTVADIAVFDPAAPCPDGYMIQDGVVVDLSTMAAMVGGRSYKTCEEALRRVIEDGEKTLKLEDIKVLGEPAAGAAPRGYTFARSGDGVILQRSWVYVNGTKINDRESDCSVATGCARWHYVAAEKKIYLDSEGAAYIVYGYVGSGIEVESGKAAAVVIDSWIALGNPREIAPCFQEIQYDYWNKDLGAEMLQALPSDHPEGGCAACWNGRYTGRALDGKAGSEVTYLVRMSAAEGRHASIGIARGPENEPDAAYVPTRLWEWLPGQTLDGVNDAGVYIGIGMVAAGGTNHVRTTGTNPGADRLNVEYVPRFLLDNADSPSHAVELLKGRDLYAVGTNVCQWLLAGDKEAYIVQCVDNRLVVHKAEDREAAIGVECYDDVTNGLAEVSSRLDMLRHLTNGWDCCQAVHTCAYDLEKKSLAVVVAREKFEPCYIDSESGYGKVVKPVAVIGEAPFEGIAAAIGALAEGQTVADIEVIDPDAPCPQGYAIQDGAVVDLSTMAAMLGDRYYRTFEETFRKVAEDGERTLALADIKVLGAPRTEDAPAGYAFVKGEDGFLLKNTAVIVNGVPVDDRKKDCSVATGCARWHYVAAENKLYLDSEGAAYIFNGYIGSGVGIERGKAAVIVLDSWIASRDPREIVPGIQEIRYDYWRQDLGVTELRTLTGDSPIGGCAACWNGRFVGRNLDWKRADAIACLVRMSAAKGRHASLGIARGLSEDSNEAWTLTRLWEWLPEQTLDGINDAGVYISVDLTDAGEVSSVAITGTNPGKPRLDISYLPRFVLDNADTPAHAIELLKERDLYSIADGEARWLIAGASEAYSVRCVDNELVVTEVKDRAAVIGIEGYDCATNGLAEVSSRLEMLRHMANGCELREALHVCAYDLGNNSLAVMAEDEFEPCYVDFESGCGEAVKPVAVAGEVPYESIAAAIAAVEADESLTYLDIELVYPDEAEPPEGYECIGGRIYRSAALLGFPAPIAGLVYNGKEQVGISSTNNLYEAVEGSSSALHAGEYTAVVAPAQGFFWKNGTATNVCVAFSIAKAKLKVTATDTNCAIGTMPILECETAGWFADDSWAGSEREPEPVTDYTVNSVIKKKLKTFPIYFKEEFELPDYAIEFVKGTLTVTDEPGPDMTAVWKNFPGEYFDVTAVVKDGELFGFDVVQTEDVHGTLKIDDNLGSIFLDLNGHSIIGDVGKSAVLVKRSRVIVIEEQGVLGAQSAPSEPSEPEGEATMIVFRDGDQTATSGVFGGKGANAILFNAYVDARCDFDIDPDFPVRLVGGEGVGSTEAEIVEKPNGGRLQAIVDSTESSEPPVAVVGFSKAVAGAVAGSVTRVVLAISDLDEKSQDDNRREIVEKAEEYRKFADDELGFEFLDIAVRTFKDEVSGDDIAELDGMVRISLDYDLAEAVLVKVWRRHGGTLEEIPEGEANARDGEYWKGDRDQGRIALYVKKFSAYMVSAMVKPACRIGNLSYVTIEEALDAVKDGDTITLSKDIASKTISFTGGAKQVTIDLAGNDISSGSADVPVIRVAGGTGLRIVNSGSNAHVIGSLEVADGSGLRITGGSFSEYPEQYIEDGCVIRLNADGTYFVAPITEFQSLARDFNEGVVIPTIDKNRATTYIAWLAESSLSDAAVLGKATFSVSKPTVKGAKAGMIKVIAKVYNAATGKTVRYSGEGYPDKDGTLEVDLFKGRDAVGTVRFQGASVVGRMAIGRLSAYVEGGLLVTKPLDPVRYNACHDIYKGAWTAAMTMLDADGDSTISWTVSAKIDGNGGVAVKAFSAMGDSLSCPAKLLVGKEGWAAIPVVMTKKSSKRNASIACVIWLSSNGDVAVTGAGSQVDFGGRPSMTLSKKNIRDFASELVIVQADGTELEREVDFDKVSLSYNKSTGIVSGGVKIAVGVSKSGKTVWKRFKIAGVIVDDYLSCNITLKDFEPLFGYGTVE